MTLDGATPKHQHKVQEYIDSLAVGQIWKPITNTPQRRIVAIDGENLTYECVIDQALKRYTIKTASFVRWLRIYVARRCTN